MPLTYTLTETPTPEDAAALKQGLDDYFEQLGADRERLPFAIFARDDHGAITAGLIAKTGWDQMYISTLFVVEAARGQGIGTHLMAQAEAEGRRRECLVVWLMTSTPEGKGFYELRGYECFGAVERHAPSCSRYFLKKAL
ncbi:MAG: GNAT family N-acetyltransferase [Rhodospirillaceae bacterium]